MVIDAILGFRKKPSADGESRFSGNIVMPNGIKDADLDMINSKSGTNYQKLDDQRGAFTNDLAGNQIHEVIKTVGSIHPTDKKIYKVGRYSHYIYFVASILIAFLIIKAVI